MFKGFFFRCHWFCQVYQAKIKFIIESCVVHLKKELLIFCFNLNKLAAKLQRFLWDDQMTLSIYRKKNYYSNGSFVLCLKDRENRPRMHEDYQLQVQLGMDVTNKKKWLPSNWWVIPNYNFLFFQKQPIENNFTQFFPLSRI